MLKLQLNYVKKNTILKERNSLMILIEGKEKQQENKKIQMNKIFWYLLVFNIFI